MADDTAPYDPCVAFVKLREAYHAAAAGETVKSVRFKTGEDERQTDFGPANLPALRQAMNEARDECRRLQGLPTRFAISAGSPGPLRRIY